MTLDPDRVRQDNIFVVGCQRSGTSVIWASLIAHPDLKPLRGYDPETGYDPKELYYFYNIFEARKKFDSPLYGWDVDREYLKELINLTVRHCAKHHGAADGRWVSAKPLDGLHVQELTESIPEAKIVFVLRHPQEVVWSSMHAPWANAEKRTLGAEAESAANHWRRFAAIAIDILDGRFDDNVLLVRHEEVISQPQRVAASLAEHVRVSNSPMVLEQLRAPTFNSSFENGTDPAELVGKTREKIASEEEFCAIVDAVAGKEMMELGYENMGKARVHGKSSSPDADPGSVDRVAPPSLRVRAISAEAAHAAAQRKLAEFLKRAEEAESAHASAQSQMLEFLRRAEYAEDAHSVAQQRIAEQLEDLHSLNVQWQKTSEELANSRSDALRLSERVTGLESELQQANVRLEGHLEVLRQWIRTPGKLR